MKKDEQIQHDVMEEIKYEPQLSSIASNIGVAVNNGVVTLSGQVESFIQKHCVEEVAQRVKGVEVIAMDIEVLVGMNSKKSDTAIAQAVKESLQAIPSIDLSALEIKVDDGWVTIEGTVHWNYQRKSMEDAIRNLTGVNGVNNMIQLTDEPCDPNTITENISAAFHRHATIDAERVHIEIVGKRVILTGKVRSWTEKKDAENAAWSSKGVMEVENKIVVDSRGYIS